MVKKKLKKKKHAKCSLRKKKQTYKTISQTISSVTSSTSSASAAVAKAISKEEAFKVKVSYAERGHHDKRKIQFEEQHREHAEAALHNAHMEES